MSETTQTYIITAGGIGKRMNSEIPKQFIELDGKPILWHTLNSFYSFNPKAQLILTLPQDWIEFWNKLIENLPEIPYEIVSGGIERYDSIKNALKQANGSIIGIHDGVRPFVNSTTLKRTLELAKEKGTAIPVLSLKESIRKVGSKKTSTVNRADYRSVQTPQCFQADIIRKAYEQEFHENITDDASLVEEDGHEIFICEGNEENIKITTPFDLILAEALISTSW